MLVPAQQTVFHSITYWCCPGIFILLALQLNGPWKFMAELEATSRTLTIIPTYTHTIDHKHKVCENELLFHTVHCGAPANLWGEAKQRQWISLTFPSFPLYRYEFDSVRWYKYTELYLPSWTLFSCVRTRHLCWTR